MSKMAIARCWLVLAPELRTVTGRAWWPSASMGGKVRALEGQGAPGWVRKRLLSHLPWASVSLHGNNVGIPASIVMVYAWNPSNYKLEQEGGEVGASLGYTLRSYL